MDGLKRALLLMDANVLIDFATADATLLAVVASHVTQVWVAREVLAEVDDVTDADLLCIGVGIAEASVPQLLEAGAGSGALSFEDRLCLILARDHGWDCVTNDRPLRRACLASGVTVRWGLRLVIDLYREQGIDLVRARSAIAAICDANPRMPESLRDRALRVLSDTEPG